jgi:hypothetical protein
MYRAQEMLGDDDDGDQRATKRMDERVKSDEAEAKLDETGASTGCEGERGEGHDPRLPGVDES